MFRLNLYFPLFAALFLTSLITLISVVYVQENTIHKSKAKVADQYTHFLEQKVNYDAAVISEYIHFIQTDHAIAEKFQEGDKKDLYNAMHGIYERLNRDIDLTHMYFIKTDGTVFLRMHDYSRDQDRVDRATFLKAQKTQKLTYGLEFGIKKNYTLRVVKPWYVDGKLIGYIELGKEINKIIDEYTHLLGTNVYLAVKKEVYRDVPDFVLTNLKEKKSADNYYVVYNTYAVPEQINSILNGSIDHTDIVFNDHDYYVSKTKLSDFSKKDLGYFVFLQDVTMEHKVMYGSLKALFAMLIIITVIFFITGYLLIRKKEKNIHILTSRLEEKKEKLLLFNSKLQKLFDLQKNIVILTNGKRLIMANKTMLDFFGYQDINHFFEHYNCICERFIEDDTFFHLGKVPENRNWVETLKTLSPENQIVALLDQEQATHVFSVSINGFEDNDYVIAFTDISNTMREQIILLQKVIHDKLTGVYNREFLECNFASILKMVSPKKLGVVMCDIDYFKRINDTYGHNRGDEVLKEFVTVIYQTIRNDDYLIRWGGEEFIVLLKIDSAESLKKVAEHIRINIAKNDFEEVGTITSSFGAALYRENESIYTTIARADKALYEAKANGRNRVEII